MVKVNAKNVASQIFQAQFDMYEDELSTKEVLEGISDLISTLKKKIEEYPRQVAKHLQAEIGEYTDENDLCPECYSETECKTTHTATHWQPQEGVVFCISECGYSEYV